MAVKTITYPPLVVISGNETLLEVLVENAYNSLGTSTPGEIQLQSFYHEPGDTMVFAWNGITATFTCVAAALFTGALGTYPQRSTENLSQWGAKVLNAFMSHYQLANDFKITGSYSGYYTITFEPYIKEAIYNLSITVTTQAQYTKQNSSYTPDDLYQDYRLRLQLFQDNAKFRSPVFIPFIYSGLNASLQYNLQRLLYTDQAGHFTFPETDIRHAHDILKRTYLQLSFLADNLSAESVPLEHYVYVLPGKMSDTKEKTLNTQNTSIYADLVSSKRFLSLAPVIKDTDIYAPEKLYFLFQSAYASARLQITERFRNDPAETRTLATFTTGAFTLHEFSVGFQSIKQADYGTKVVTEYDIWIEITGGTLISERRTFRLDYTYQRHARYFLFKNSYGMYELFRSTGDAEKVNKTTKEFYEPVQVRKTDRDQSRKPINILHDYQMQVNTGYLEDPLNFYYAHEFLGSDDVYWLKNNRAYAVQIEPSDPALSRSDLDNLHEFDFLVSLDDMDDSFFTQFLPGSELPVLGDFSDDFNDDFFT